MSSDGRIRRREPWIHIWEEDGVQRQTVVHYTQDDTAVIFDPRHPGDEEPWFDSVHDGASSAGRYRDEDVVTLGSPDQPGYGITDPDLYLDDDPDEVDPAPPAPTRAGKEHPVISKIADVINHRALLHALNTIRAEVDSRQEDVDNLASWSGEMTARMQGVAEELRALNVDTNTIGNIAALADNIAGQAEAAERYKNATDTAVAQAGIAAKTAHRNHGRIQDAVDDSDVPMAKPGFYNAE